MVNKVMCVFLPPEPVGSERVEVYKIYKLVNYLKKI